MEINKDVAKRVLSDMEYRKEQTEDTGYAAYATIREILTALAGEPCGLLDFYNKLSEKDNGKEDNKESSEVVKPGSGSRANKPVQKTGGVDLQRPL